MTPHPKAPGPADRRRLAALALACARVTFSRASGAGGQHRDKTETRAELVLTRDDLAGLAPDDREALAGALGLDRRPLRLASEDDRSRVRNRAAVEARLQRRVLMALAPRPERRPTRPGRAAVERRLEQKARRSAVKRERAARFE